jgi:hypothetical protein
MDNYSVTDQNYLGEVSKTINKIDSDATIWSIPADPANSDYQAYLQALEKEKE